MQNFDFLSTSPNIFIFRKETNKTIFGGILFLIYIIIMILISLLYILDYTLNEKYSIEYSSVYNYTRITSEIKLMDSDTQLNPYLDIKIFIDAFCDPFVAIYKMINGKPILLEEKYDETTGVEFAYYELKEKVNDTEFNAVFKCGEDPNCTEFYYFINQWANSPIGYFYHYSPGFINHEKDPPIVKKNDVKNFFVYSLYMPNTIGIKQSLFDWEVIKYKDKRNLFDTLTNNKREYYTGHVKGEEKTSESVYQYPEDYTDYIFYDENIGYYIVFFTVKYFNPHRDYLLYKRTKFQFMDVIANIGALFSTIKFFFAIGFYFYSRNYDNYEIVGKILNPPKEKKEIILLNSKIKSEENKIINEINNNLDKLIEDDTDKNKNELNKKEYNVNNYCDYDEEDNQGNSGNALKKLNFYDFFFNNIYLKCCRKNKNQELINNVNDIVYKYLSIDYLLYNQIKLENLFKDYQWNNPELNDIQNNKLITKLKNT